MAVYEPLMAVYAALMAVYEALMAVRTHPSGCQIAWT
jgi:hypothetical protein